MEALRWAKAQRPRNATQRALLMAIADYADKDGKAWPSQKTLADEMLLTDRTIRSALAALEDACLIMRFSKRNPDGTRGVDRVQLVMTDALHDQAISRIQRKNLPVAGPPENASETTGKCFRNHRKLVPQPPEAASGQEPSGEPSKRNPQRTHSEADASGVPAVAAPPSLSLRDRLWMDGVAALISLGAPDKLSRQMVGRWLRDQDGDAGRVLWAIEEAVTAGSGDPVPYVTRLLSDRTQNHGERTGAHSARNGGGTKFDNVAAGVALGTAAFRQRLRKRSGHDRERPDHEALPDDPGGTAAYPSAAIAYLAAYR